LHELSGSSRTASFSPISTAIRRRLFARGRRGSPAVTPAEAGRFKGFRRGRRQGLAAARMHPAAGDARGSRPADPGADRPSTGAIRRDRLP
jgi:hypothetical protein